MDGDQNPDYDEDDCNSVVTDIGDDEVDSVDSAESAAGAFMEVDNDAPLYWMEQQLFEQLSEMDNAYLMELDLQVPGDFPAPVEQVDYSNRLIRAAEEAPVVDNPIDTEGLDGHYLELNDLDCPLWGSKSSK